MKRTLTLIFFLLLAGTVFPQAEPTPERRALQTEIQNELACFCGCGMTIQGCLGGMICSESKAVSKEVGALLETGKSKPEVLQAMVVKYGERILAAPTTEGFNLTAWVLPFAALAVGGVIVAVVIFGWKRQTAPAPAPLTVSAPAPDKKAVTDPYQERFERELRDFN